jgi:hypothetical protein
MFAPPRPTPPALALCFLYLEGAIRVLFRLKRGRMWFVCEAEKGKKKKKKKKKERWGFFFWLLVIGYWYYLRLYGKSC